MTPAPNTPEWYEFRRSFIGASEIAAVLGMSPYDSPTDIYLRKIGMAQESEGTSYTRWGHVLEPAIAQVYSETTGRELNPGSTVLHPEIPFFGATPDYYCGEDGLVQCKTANRFVAKEFGEEGTDAVPDRYQCQCQWELGVTGRKWCDLALFSGTDRDLRIFRIEFRREQFDLMSARAQKFWLENVLKMVPPEPSGHPRETELIHDAFPVATEETISSSYEIDETLAQMEALLQDRRTLDTRIERCEQVAKSFMGNAVKMLTPHGWFTWANQSRSTTDWKAVLSDMGLEAPIELIDKHTRRTESRVFRKPAGFGGN